MMLEILDIDYRERRKRLGLWATLAVVGSLLLTRVVVFAWIIGGYATEKLIHRFGTSNSLLAIGMQSEAGCPSLYDIGYPPPPPPHTMSYTFAWIMPIALMTGGIACIFTSTDSIIVKGIGFILIAVGAMVMLAITRGIW